MKFLVLILQVATVAIASEIAFNCRFINYKQDKDFFKEIGHFTVDSLIGYECEYEDETGITEPNINVTSIVGDHKEGSTNDDVTMLEYKGSTKYLAKGISKFFPNIEAFKAYNVGLEHISRSDFEGLGKIFYLELEHNKLKDIPDDTFVDLVNLKVLRFGENKLEKIPNLKTLTNLKYLYLDYNQIKSITAEDLSGNQELKKLNLSHNKLTFIDQNILKNLPKYFKGRGTNAWFRDNPCIDMDTYNDRAENIATQIREHCQQV